jgi:hypothetical protein
MQKNYWTKFGITSGLINSSILLLEIISKYRKVGYNDLMKNKNLTSTDLSQSIFFLQDLNLIRLFHDEIISIGTQEFDKSPNYIYKKILRSYVTVFIPAWTNRLHWGVKAVLSSLSLDEYHCFKEAGLINLDDFDVYKWWSSLPVYGNSINNKSTNGLIGEFLTMDFEENRVGVRPRMMSSESSKHGYDVLSKMKSTELTNKFIEVKTISNPSMQEIFLSNHEWQTALRKGEEYVFHFWILNKEKKNATLYEYSVSNMINHVPSDSLSGCGVFDSAKINVSDLLAATNYLHKSSLTKYKIE